MKKLFIYLLIASFVLSPIMAEAKSTPVEIKARGSVSGLRISAVDGGATASGGAFIDNLDITSLTPDKGLILHSASVTQANSRISAVDGTSFIDFSSGTNLTDHLGKYLVYKDSAGRQIRSWIKSAGTGETYTDIIGGTNPALLNGDFSAGDTVWNKETGWTIADGIASKSTQPIYEYHIYQSAGVVQFGLYKTIYSLIVTNSQFRIKIGVSPYNSGAYRTTNGTYTEYITDSYSGTQRVLVAGASNSAGSVDNINVQKVLTPSTTGVTLTSTKNGSTYNWEYKDPSFNYNDENGYTYQIIDRDLSAFCDGNHLIEVYDSAGRMLKGVLGSVGTGETTVALASPIPGSAWTGASGTTPPTGWLSNIILGNHTIFDSGDGAPYNACLKLSQKDAVAAPITSYNFSSTALTLHTYSFAFKHGTGQSGKVVICSSSNGANPFVTFDLMTDAAWTTKSGYITPNVNNPYFLFRANTNAADQYELFDTVIVNKITTPSASGSTVVSQKGGTTYNWAYKSPTFNYNQTTPFTVVIKKIKGRSLNLSGTTTGIRFSAVDDTAFVDNLPAGVLAFADGNHWLRVYDSSGTRYVEGVLKAVGGGAEGLGSSLNVNNCANDATTPFSTFDGASAAGFHAINTLDGANRAATADEIPYVTGELHKTVLSLSIASGSAPRMSLATNAYGSVVVGKPIFTLLAGLNTSYNVITQTNTGTVHFWSGSLSNFTISGLAHTKVLTPSASGATIVNAIGGTVYRFTTKDAAFNYNDTGTLWYEVWSRGD